YPQSFPTRRSSDLIEEETIDRGSEMLNILLYLRECADDDIEPSLEDFLKEFLLVEEDEFQDEYRIYEKLIANQILIESDFAAAAQVAKTLTEEEELLDRKSTRLNSSHVK